MDRQCPYRERQERSESIKFELVVIERPFDGANEYMLKFDTVKKEVPKRSFAFAFVNRSIVVFFSLASCK